MAAEEHAAIVRALPAVTSDLLDAVGDINRYERCEAESAVRRIAIRNYDIEKCIPIRRLRVAGEYIACGEPAVVPIPPPSPIGNMMDVRATMAETAPHERSVPDGQGDVAGC